MYRESEILEKKSSFAAWKEIIISLSAFTNKKGGKVIVGLDDQGNPTGLNIGKNALEEMANKIKMHTDPILYPSINVKTFGPGEIVELEIPESDNKPVFAFEKAYVRVGKTNQKLSATEIRDLVKRYTLSAALQSPGSRRSVAPHRLCAPLPPPYSPALAHQLTPLHLTTLLLDGPLRRPLRRYTAHAGGSATPVATAP
jgi:hypothetical protein